MTPKQKAKELFKKFNEYADSNYGANNFEKKWFGNTLAGERKVRKESAKQCALIAVDEILNINWVFCEPVLMDDLTEEFKSKGVFWNEVKQEIEKL